LHLGAFRGKAFQAVAGSRGVREVVADFADYARPGLNVTTFKRVDPAQPTR